MQALSKHISAIHFLTIPLVLGSFAAGLFFRGTDNILIFPHLATMVVLAGIVAWQSFRDGWRLPSGTFVTALLMYWAYIWISIIWSTVPYNSTFFAMIFSVLPFMFFVNVVAPDPERWLKIHFGALACGAVALAVWAFVQFFILEVGARVHDPMLNPNNLSVIFNMALFPALALYIFAKKRALIILGFLLALIYFSGLLVTQSRGGLLACLIALVVFLFFVRGQAGFGFKRLLPFVLAAAGVFVVVHTVSNGVLGTDFLKVFRPGEAEIHTVTERKLIWSGTWNMIQDHFWTGTGLATFIYFYPRYRLFGDYSDGYFSHMDPLQFWAEMGVFAPVLFYAVLITILLRTIRATRASATDSPERLWMYGCFCGLLVLAGHAHISFHLYMPIILFVAAFLLAGWYIATQRILKDAPPIIRFQKRGEKIIAQVAVVLILFSPVFWLGKATAGVHYINQTQALMLAQKKDEARIALDTARKFAPENYAPLYDYEARYHYDLFQNPPEGTKADEQERLYREAQKYNQRSIVLNPGFANFWNLRALIYFSGYPALEPDGRDKAEKLLVKTLEANPILLDARIGLAHIYKAKGEIAKAKAVLEDANNHPMPKGAGPRYRESIKAMGL